MTISKEFVSYLEDMFSVLPGTSIRKMFGGVGIFRDGLMYGLSMSDGRICLKADDETRADFIGEGCEEWVYERKDCKRTSMNYWYMPERLADDPDELKNWADKAFAVALRADAKKPPSQRKFKG